MHDLFVHGQHLQLGMGEVQDGAAGSLVDAVILHADETVLHDVDDADAVLAAQLVELFDDLAGLHLLAVHGHGSAGLEVDGHIGGLVRSLEGGHAHLQEAGLIQIRLVGGILQIQTLMAQMPQVLILGVVGLAGDLQRHVVGLGVIDLLLTGLDVPLTPRGDDLHIGGKTLDGQLETDLIVTLAGGAVGDGVSALGLGDLRQLLADDGTGKGGAQQVGLILGVHLQAGDDHVVHHLVHQIGHDQLAGAGLERLLLQTLQLIGLTHVAGHGDDLGVIVVLLQPGNDDRGIQAAGVGQYDLLDICMFHGVASLNVYVIYVNYYTFHS